MVNVRPKDTNIFYLLVNAQYKSKEQHKYITKQKPEPSLACKTFIVLAYVEGLPIPSSSNFLTYSTHKYCKGQKNKVRQI